MRTLLISTLLMIVVIGLYASAISEDDGVNEKIRDSAGKISDSISRIDP